jgi:hypothetical protein
MITRGPIVRGQLYALIGGVLWVIQSRIQDSYGSLSVAVGILAIGSISMGVHILMDARSRRTPKDDSNL